jgi:hypothetical protein
MYSMVVGHSCVFCNVWFISSVKIMISTKVNRFKLNQQATGYWHKLFTFSFII